MLPRWYYAHSLASRLVALEKKKVGRRELKPVRPIGVGSAVHRLICSAVVEHAKSVFLRLLAPIQVAVNVEAAAEKLDTSAEDAANKMTEAELQAQWWGEHDDDADAKKIPGVKYIPSEKDVAACMGDGQYSYGECRTILMGEHHF